MLPLMKRVLEPGLIKEKKHMGVELNDEEQVEDHNVQQINEPVLLVASPT